jgi:hypothetical protein
VALIESAGEYEHRSGSAPLCGLKPATVRVVRLQPVELLTPDSGSFTVQLIFTVAVIWGVTRITICALVERRM